MMNLGKKTLALGLAVLGSCLPFSRMVAAGDTNHPSGGRPAPTKEHLPAEDILDTGLDPQGAVRRRYAVTGVPLTLIIDRAGRVHHLFPGFRPTLRIELEKTLTDLLRSG